MTMQITIEVPDALGQQLLPYRDRLAEVLARGLQEVEGEGKGVFQDEQAIIELLTSRPSPDQVLVLKPSPALQQRMSELLQRGKEGNLARAEERELERLLLLEHLVRLAKTHAAKQRPTTP